jgi:NAD(P)-dependent dehydrogenase (short-subunit alcohol dehydrogenase family)
MTRTWFITGASRGVGRALTTLLLDRGDRVAATARNPEALADLRRDTLWRAALDVRDAEAVRRTVDRAFADLGRIDVVVSNAGYGLFGAAEEVTDEELVRQVDTNLVGSVQLARAVVPHLRAQGGGRIVQVSSSGGQVASPAMSVYHATKWGIEGFYESAAAELAPFGIEVTLVEPGGVRTDFAGGSMAMADPLPAYADGPVGQIRTLLAAHPEAARAQIPGDPAKVAAAIAASADTTPAPKRLTLGSDAYDQITAALRDRLTALESQKDLAMSTDAG